MNWFDPVIPSNIWVTRAYENQLFFVVANRLGEEVGFSFSGGSCVIAPNGAILDHVRQKTGIAYGTIRLPRDTDASRFPRRRPELYRELSLRRFNWSRNLLARTFSTPPLPDGGILRVAVSPFVPAGETLRERQAALCDHLWEECPTAELAVFPELALTGAGPLFLSDPAEELRPLARYCAEQGLCLVVGGALRENALYNAAFVITEEGEVHTYRKAHLSAGETGRFAAGDKAGLAVTLRGIRLGVLLGDDALLPEPAVLLADSCCDLIAIPAALVGICNEMIPYGTPGTKWHLIRNRANETNTYPPSRTWPALPAAPPPASSPTRWGGWLP